MSVTSARATLHRPPTQLPAAPPNPASTIALDFPGGETSTTHARLSGRAPGSPPSLSGYTFLLDSDVPADTLRSALAAADRWDVPLPDALLSTGAISSAAYAESVAKALDLPCVLWGFDVVRGAPLAHIGGKPVHRARLPGGVDVIALPANGGPLDGLSACLRALAWTGLPAVIVPDRALDEARERASRKSALRQATFGLLRRQPTMSAALPPWTWQIVALVTAAGLLAGGALIAPGATIAALLCLLSVPFVGVVLVRLVALYEVLQPRAGSGWQPTISDADLPIYSVLVPLFDEVNVLPDLIASLSQLEYPSAKLDLILVLEEADIKTKAALLAVALPANLRVIVVPEFAPRTKPKALNYALQFARGRFIVVFDAEDRPEPDQLRQAIAAFQLGPPNLACVQARLNIYNARDSWLSRQFAVEYSALFDAILPALDRLSLPVPLGGTSNHFRREILEAIGGWDPHNVTEDADIGIRLARFGYVTHIIPSTTWEEAPTTWRQWKPQRTRWLKGWYQTYLVHTRHLGRLRQDLGRWQTLGFHLFLGGLILSALMHPVFYLLLAWTWFAGQAFAIPDVLGGRALWWLTGATVAISYISSITIGAVAARRRGHALALSALQMPVCWLLISYAAYRALWQLIRDPFLWEKTAHGQGVPKAGAKPGTQAAVTRREHRL